MNQPTKWRLKRTLKRRLEFRPIENDDVRFAWAGYKHGALIDMAGPFLNTELNAVEFKSEFERTVITRYHGAWTLLAETKRGFMPVGMLFAFHSHADPTLSPFMIIGDLVWFPWASKRNKIESAVNFFKHTGKELPMMDYAHGETNRKFFEMIAKHGVMRRVGTTYNVARGESVAIFETRAL